MKNRPTHLCDPQDLTHACVTHTTQLPNPCQNLVEWECGTASMGSGWDNSYFFKTNKVKLFTKSNQIPKYSNKLIRIST